MESPKRVVYLFGAGASHAQIQFHDKLRGKEFDRNQYYDRGLLVSHVSARIFKNIPKRKNTTFRKVFTSKLDQFNNPYRAPNIEHIITLLESSGIQRYMDLAGEFRKAYRLDILDKQKKIRPVLYKGLLEHHKLKKIKKHEIVLGYLSLNQDTLLDGAYSEIISNDIRYCTDKQSMSDMKHPPLLKLHGSFNWKNIDEAITVVDNHNIDEEEQCWIPPGIEKKYIAYPYNLIWGITSQILNQSKELENTVLRVVGCSLDQNDWPLINLIFQSQFRDKKYFPYTIELINFFSNEKDENDEKERLALFPNVKTIMELDTPPPTSRGGEYPDNPFKEWLKERIKKFKIEKTIRKSRYPNLYQVHTK